MNHLFITIALILVMAQVSMSHAGADPEIMDRLYDDYGLEVSGFFEVRQGWRIKDDPHEKGRSISEARGQMQLERDMDWGLLQVKGDMVGDLVLEKAHARFREFNIAFSPLDDLDMKLGRQTLTWGTGDLLFINDLFPKDWVSFFIGRDDEYLKAPSDAVKTSFFSKVANIDFVYSPVFNGSDYIDGSRLSYWNAVTERISGQDFIFHDHDRNSFFNESEFALRIYKTINSMEFALYGYRGYWKTPEGFDAVAMKLFYPPLQAYGTTVRASLLGGIGSLEAGYYDSMDDPGGDDAFIRNSEFRLLTGFERELAMDLTGGFQYYLEWMSDYEQYEKGVAREFQKDEFRHVLTLRLTKLLMNQNLKLSFFAFYSPSDEDAYLRPNIRFKVTDAWTMDLGSNLFLGEHDHSFFGQFRNNSNVYLGVRYGF